ncbi:S1 family peptidase [Actinokineospora inagensis]|uniref:S1 family peptidase n=1 Tax=Actinokineospora inagensis TaxID=103730 RepID=UPI0004227511|nr:S1 family peptidase [Actinokineospora inagensis]
MKRTLVAAAVLTASAGVVVAAPAFAGQDAAKTEGVSNVVLDTMQRDLGLSHDAALARIASENRATALESTLRASLGDTFGGAYYDAPSATLVVGVTDQAKIAAAQSAGATAKFVSHSARQLDTTADTLNAKEKSAPAGITGWYVDVQHNTVTVTTARGTLAAAHQFLTTTGVDLSTTQVVESTESPRVLYDVRGGDAYYIGSGARCSVGFSVQGGFVSAGHCGNRGDSTSGSNRVAQGTFQASTFPGRDYSWVKTNANWTPRGVVNRYSGSTTVAVQGSTESAVGAAICRSGSTTGWHCGTVQAKNQTVRYSEGAVNGLTRTNVCAEPGDSGGSWLSGTQAQGVTSGGSGNCTSGGTTYFQPVNPILSTYSLRLVTS